MSGCESEAAGAEQRVQPGCEEGEEVLLVEETDGGRCRVLRRARAPLYPAGGSSARRRKAECPRRRRRGVRRGEPVPIMEEDPEEEEEEEEEEEALVVQEDEDDDEGLVIPDEPQNQHCQGLVYLEKDTSPHRDPKREVEEDVSALLIHEASFMKGSRVGRGRRNGSRNATLPRHCDARNPRSSRSKTGSLQLICKSEPEVEPLEYDIKETNLSAIGISDEEELLISEEEPPFKDDPRDETYKPDLAREPPKVRRKLGKTKDEKEIKVEIEVKEEENALREVEDLPRKGRRRKDDKTPRLPKRRKKPPIQYVRCEMEGCGTVLAHPRYLQHHIKYQHLLKKKYVCPHPSCGRLFRLQKQLLRHAKHHTDQRDYICEYCARAFKSSHNLAVHRMIHTGEKPLQCEICGFTCRQKASLNWHMKKHDADSFYQFSCNICGKKFEKKDSVVAHKAKSHPEVLIAEALAANAGALITSTDILASNPDSIAPSTDGQGLSLLPGAGDVYCTPMDRMSMATDGKMLMGCGSNIEGLVMNTGILSATTEVMIEDSADSAGR
ncbi:E3 ubiquitin-protein ligase ZFP91 isoform X2 [Ambystoma mexicanum]|uniref:E3 ubiquitin-protein ligase ZFP91 isoform X2 n=1 Tax=Ambystoma mexicanum TaxID=8296 RepID=UPI0037E9BEC2